MGNRYQACLQDMYQRLPMYTRIGDAAYKTGLDNILQLSDRLGNPHLLFKSIHVAGTNGKGSCSHMLASVFQSAGYKTGLYTSPHIHDFRERIQINGKLITEQEVILFMEKISPWLEDIKASFFEITVAMAFDFFAKQQVDIAIVEVGLGGLLDSTNIITPELSLITNISLDHTSLLGKTIEEIAVQKAGIIKPTIPVVISETDQQTEKIFFSKAILNGSSILFADSRFEMTSREELDFGFRVKVVDMALQEINVYDVELKGIYQNKNLKAVLACIEVMRQKGWHLTEGALRTGLRGIKRNTHFQGRFDIVHHQPMVILDASHNEAGIRLLVQQISQMPKSELFIILAFMKDKEPDQFLPLFPKNAHYFFTQANIPRALGFEELRTLARGYGLEGLASENVTLALEKAFQQSSSQDMIVVCGSFFIMDEAYDFMKKKSSKHDQ